ncbi:hypothetical protein E4U49_000317, partial [Claviceps purpurea]
LRANGTKLDLSSDSFVLTTGSGSGPIYARESYGIYWFQLEDPSQGLTNGTFPEASSLKGKRHKTFGTPYRSSDDESR